MSTGISPPQPTDSIATLSDSNDRSETDHSLSRRTVIAAGGTTTLASLAGCSAIADFLAEFALKEVNVFNGADERISGTVEIVDPTGDLVLEESFDLAAADDDDETDEANETAALYSDVWTDAGDYEASIELEQSLEADPTTTADGTGNESTDSSSDVDSGVDNESTGNSSDADSGTDEDAEPGSSAAETVTIDDPAEEHLVVGIDQDEPDELISFHVIEEFSDLEEEFE